MTGVRASFTVAEPVRSGLHPSEITEPAPIDRNGIVAKVVVGELLQLFQFGVDGGGTGEVGVEGGLLGVHHGLTDVIDDATMNVLFDQEAKLFINSFRIKN